MRLFGCSACNLILHAHCYAPLYQALSVLKVMLVHVSVLQVYLGLCCARLIGNDRCVCGLRDARAWQVIECK